MKKRSIIFIITLILCAVMLPLSVSAADDGGADHVHAVNPETGECECGLSYTAGVKSGDNMSYFGSLKEALDSVQKSTDSSTTVLVYKDLVFGENDERLNVCGGTFRLDLGGHTITGTGEYGTLLTLYKWSNLPATDVVIENGTLINDKYYTVLVSSNASATFRDVNITMNSASEDTNYHAVCVSHNAAKVSFESGVFTSDGCGLFVASSYSTGSYIPAEITISGGEFTGGWMGVNLHAGNVVVTGGKFTSTSDRTNEYSFFVGNDTDSVLISGGEFMNGVDMYVVRELDHTLSEILAEGYTFSYSQEDGTTIDNLYSENRTERAPVYVKPHTHDLSSGVCACGYTYAVEITRDGVTEKYIFLHEAIDALASSTDMNTTLRLLSDLKFSGRVYTVPSGTFTLDLNGKNIQGSITNALTFIADEGKTVNVTLINSDAENDSTISCTSNGSTSAAVAVSGAGTSLTIGDGTNDNISIKNNMTANAVIVKGGGNLNILGGNFRSSGADSSAVYVKDGNARISGGSFDGWYSVRLTSGSFKLSGGTYTGSVVVENDGFLTDLLAEGYILSTDQSSVVLPEGFDVRAKDLSSGTYYCIAHEHDFKFTASGESLVGDDYLSCAGCGIVPEAFVREKIDGTPVYAGLTLENALDKVESENSVLVLNRDLDLGGNPLNLGGNLTLDLNGHTLSADQNVIAVGGGSSSVIIANSSKTEGKLLSRGKDSAAVTLNGGRLDIGTESFSNLATLASGGYCLDNASGTLTISGGRFSGKLRNQGGKAADLLAGDHIFSSSGDKAVYIDASDETLSHSGDYFVIAHKHSFNDNSECGCGFVCAHPDMTENFYCPDCDTLFVASVNEVFFADIEKAVGAAVNQTSGGAVVKLLNDINLDGSLEIKKGSFTLDLGGKSIISAGTAVIVSDDQNTVLKLTITDSGDAGKIEGGLAVSFANASSSLSLKGGEYDSVSVKGKVSAIIPEGFAAEINGVVVNPDETSVPDGNGNNVLSDFKIVDHEHDYDPSDGRCACGDKAAIKVTLQNGINMSFHKTMSEAFGAMCEYATMTLFEDCVFTGTEKIRMRFTFDLNGNTLTIGDGSTASGMTLMIKTASLTFRDSVGGGKLITADKSAIEVTAGTINIISGNFDAEFRLSGSDCAMNLSGGSFAKLTIGKDVHLVDGYAYSYDNGGWFTPEADGVYENFSVVDAPIKDIAVKINGISPDKFTSYIKQKLGFTVSYTEDESSGDVTVEWSKDGKIFDGTLTNGDSSGSYTVVCKLTKSGYTYEKTITVNVGDPLDITDRLTAATIEKTPYTGSAITPDVTVGYGGETLVYGIDYTTSYTDNLKAGTAAVKISPVDGNRYTFEEKTITFEIIPKTIAVSGVTVADKIYDGKTDAVVAGSGTLTGKVGDDDLGFAVSAKFEDKNAADRKKVILEITLTGADAANYTPDETSQKIATADITPKTVTAVISAGNKVYDGKNDAAVSAEFTGTVEDETLTSDGFGITEARFENATAAKDKKVSAKITILDTNYTFVSEDGTAVRETILTTSADITKASIEAPAPVTVKIKNGVAADYETALPDLTELSEGREYGEIVYGTPETSAIGGYTISGARISDGRLGFGMNAEGGSIIGRVGEIRVIASTTNFENILLTINVEGVERIAPEMTLTPDSYRLAGGGKLILTLDRGNLPADAAVTVTGTDEKGNVILLVRNGDIFTAELPNRSTSYTFRAEFAGSFMYLPETVSVSVETSYSGLIIIPANPVKLPETENGSVTSDSDKARPGEIVTITVEPDEGYEIADVIVTDKNGERVGVIDLGGGKYAFRMPDGGAGIETVFEKKNEVIDLFDDVSEGSYYYDAVIWAIRNGVTNGIGGNLFGSDLSCTRAQVVTFLWRAAGSPEPENASGFADVLSDTYYSKAVAWAVENGVTNGVGGDLFGSDLSCTRAQVVTFLWRAAGSPEPEEMSGFTDVPSDAYYSKAVAWAVRNGVTNGTGPDTFSPDDTCTRAQIVTFLYRACN